MTAGFGVKHRAQDDANRLRFWRRDGPHMPLSKHVPRLGFHWGPLLRDHRNDAATTGKDDPAITGSIAVGDG